MSHKNFTFLFSVLSIFWMLFYGNVFAQESSTESSNTSSEVECKLHDRPETLEEYLDNLQSLLSAARSASSGTACRSNNIAIQNALLCARHIRSQATDVGQIWSETLFYFQSFGSTPYTLLDDHNRLQTTLKDISNDIRQICLRCGDNQIFEEDITLASGQVYAAKGKSVMDILRDAYRHHAEMLDFLRRKGSNLGANVYKEEDWPLFPENFSQEMANHYSTQNINDCKKSEPSWQLIKDKISAIGDFQIGYGRAINEWKEAWRLLLYATGRSSGDAAVDSQLDDEIEGIIERHVGHGRLSNSGYLINQKTISEFGKNEENKSTTEVGQDLGRRLAYDVFGRVLDDARVISGAQIQNPFSNLSETPEGRKELQEDDEINRALSNKKDAEDLNRKIRNKYYVLETLIQNKKTDSEINIVPLVNAQTKIAEMQEVAEENVEIACEILNRQAFNVVSPTCRDFVKES